MSWPEDVGRVLGGETVAGAAAVDVAAPRWHDAAQAARDELGCAYFDWLTGVDVLDAGFQVVIRVAAHQVGHVTAVLIRTVVPRDRPSVACVCDVYAGAAWHERETHEMFGIDFTGHGPLAPLLLPDEFDGHPLRKDFVLASRVVKPWPGAKEPGESDSDAAPSRRRTRPPGVPDPADWGPRPAAGPARPVEGI
jgi:NADH:ubiquinone oxidoreductase subunit C